MTRHLEVPYISTILFNCKYLYKIYCVYKNMSKYFVDIKKEKDTKGTNSKICMQKL